jgi:hypothetical protein
MTALPIAERWLALGIAPLPVPTGEKAIRIKWKEFQTELPTPDHLKKWFRTAQNLALVTGWQGLTVLDFDDAALYADWQRYGDTHPYAALVQRLTYQVHTAQGRHVYIRTPEANASRALTRADGTRWGLDIKARGGYVLAPPSLHPSGAAYTPVAPGAPILSVAALSDILPAEMLVRPTHQPQGRPPRAAQPSLDPWAAAMNPTQLGHGVIARIRAAYRLEDLLPVETETGPDFYMTCCPLHDDHDPSMWVQTDKQICGCYAGCTSKPLDFINLYARIHDLTNSEAIRALASTL